MVQKIKKYIAIGLGFICIGLGVLGIFLPLLPTTPFLLLAAYCFCKSAPRYHQLLIKHKELGPYIEHFRNKTGLPIKAKVLSIIFITVSIGCSVYTIEIKWLKVSLALTGLLMSGLILYQKTLKR